MPVERAAGGTSLVDVLDRVLDKGIVIDAWVRVSLVGIDLITVEARVVVASIDTYLKYAEAVGQVSTASRPAIEPVAADVLITEADLIKRERVLRKRHRSRRRVVVSATDDMIMPRSNSRLTELFLSSVDASVCAQKGLEWLGQHVVRRARAVGHRRRSTLAGSGAWPRWAYQRHEPASSCSTSTIDGIRWSPWHGAVSRHTSVAGSRQPETPLENASFYAVPIRPDNQLPPLGILLIESDEPRDRRRCAVVCGGAGREVPGAAAAQRHR